MEQVKIIETLLKAFSDTTIKEGDVAYIVSRTWLNKALALKSGKNSSESTDSDLTLGPIDNADIIQEIIKQPDGSLFTRLIAGSGLESFELFPEDAWKLVLDWYGIIQGQEAISRMAINTAIDDVSEPNVLYEFHPPVFRIHRLWSDISPLPIEQALKADNPPPLVVAASSKTPAQLFLKEVKNTTGIPLDRKVRLFEIPQTIPTTAPQDQGSALTPPDSPGRQQPGAWPHLLVDIATFASARDIKVPVTLPDHTGNENYNGRLPLSFYSLVTDRIIVLDESIHKYWVSTYTGQTLKSNKTTRGITSALSSKPSSARSSPAPEGAVTRGRAQKHKFGRSLGSVGLHNLGNTCYMNSALQCVRSVEELTKFFLTDAYKHEINKTNVLGYNGRVAMAYGGLLKEIYNEGRGSVSPRDFKSTVGRCQSTFSGWGQQDSQEFLGFLLDALQEDLSRVKKKPYIEKPDSTDDMINNPEAIREMAEKVWDITRKRDDSVIADLFTGMYKSTLKCPECGKISITFDPFNNLTLPLPMENMWTYKVKFFPLNDVPVKIDTELPRHSTIETLKKFISIRTGVPVERLMGAEEFKDTFFKIYGNDQDVTEEISGQDIPTMHELEAAPTNWPGKGSKKVYRSMLDIDAPPESVDWDDTRYETMVVPVFHRRPNAVGRVGGASPPHFITLTKEEASNYDSIVRKVLERVSTFTTWEQLASYREGSKTDSSDGDMVITTASDADSAGDSKVAARSVDGEEDIVDISMKDAGEDGQNANVAPITQPKKLKAFNTKRPCFSDPESFLDPALQNLFDLSYFVSTSDGAIATGWSAVDASRTLPKVSDRMPDSSPKEDDDDQASSGSWKSSPSGGEESSNEDESKDTSGQTRMVDESSDEETSHVTLVCNHRLLTIFDNANSISPQPEGRSGRGQKHGGGRKKFKGHKTYGKKGNKRRDRQMRGNKGAHRMPSVEPQPVPAAVADGGPLIRLHEGLVVDWNEDAWQLVFGQLSKKLEPLQGTKTFVDVEILNDPALKINQRRRQTRRSRGITLEECLDEFERAETLSEQDMWYCPRCKEHRRASKKFDLWRTPDYLVAHLKRFSSSGWRRDKLDVLVDFPIEGLDLTSRVIHKEDGKAEIYDLIAVDDHYGGLGGGHYTAYAKNFVDGKWYNYNDSSVSLVSDPSSVVSTAAYLLFYRRRSSGHLGGTRFAEILDKYEKSSGDEATSEAEGEQKSDDSDDTSRFGRATQKGLRRPLDLGDDSDDGLPPYGQHIRRSIEDEGVDMPGSFATSTSMTQGWSFDRLGDGTPGASGGNVSDEAQFDSSSGEDAARSRGQTEMDTEMATGDASALISVPADADADNDEEVAEIHVESDKTRQE